MSIRITTWEGGLVKGGAGLWHALPLHVDVPQLAVRLHVLRRPPCDRWVLVVEVLLEHGQVAEVLRRQLDGVDVVAATVAAAEACTDCDV